MYNNVLEPNEYSRHFLSDHNMSCSFAMDDGGRCLLDVINDPKLLQSFLESGSDENSKDPQDGTSSESAVESPQVSRSSHSNLANHLSSTEHIVDQSDQMGYSYVDSQGLLAQSGVCSSTGGLGGMSLIVTSTAGPQTYQHSSTSGATIHHLPSVPLTNLHPHSPASARSVTPVSYNIKSPGQGPSSVHSMPPPSPLQQTRSPLPSHTPSPAPAWSPAPPVLSPATSRTQPSIPSVAFQQSHNQILQTSCSVTQFVTALATQQSITQKLTLQQQQQLFLQQQLSPASQQQPSPRLTSVSAPVVTTAVAVQPPMVQLIHAPSNVALPTRTSHSTVRPIQPKLPPQILPKPATCTASNQFVSPTPAPKQAPPTPVTTAQRSVGVGLQHGAPGQLVINQGQPGVFQGPQGTILLNQIIPGMGQSPILIQGNLSNLANIPGLQLTLRPPSSASPGQSLNPSNPQNNATLIAALQSPSQHAQTLFAQAKSPIHGQQTIMIPNNIAHAHPGLTSQNINLTSAGIPNSGIISSSSQGQGFLARSNIILSPRVVGGNQSIQLQQIQTPNGPVFAFAPGQTIAVPHLTTALGNAQLAPVTLPMHGVMTTGQGVISGLSLQSHAPQSALQHQSLFGTAVPFTSHLEHSSPQVIQVPQPMAPQQVPTNHPGHIQNQHQQQQQIDHSPKPASPPKPSKVPSVNLEELLKEHGIVPENSPVPSPECQSPLIEEPVPSHPIVPSPQQQLLQALQSQQVLLEQSQGPTGLSQLKLSFTPDGNVILHQPQGPLGNTSRIQHYVSSGQVHGRSANNNISQVILPAVTTSTVSVPVITSESTPTRNHSTLIARLNAAPAVSVPDVSSLALSTSVGLSTTSCTTLTTSATTLVPMTVQSLSVNSSPIASSYVVQRTKTLPTSSDRVFIAEDVHTSQSRVVPVISSSSSAQNVQNRINHTNSTFQTIVVPNEHPNCRTMTQHTPKTVQSSHAGTTVTKNSQTVQFELQKCGHRETHLVEIADNGTTIVPSHNHPAFSPNVPNHMLQRVQKEIHELGLVKNRNPEQQKIFNLLINAQHKLMSPLQNKSKASRANQNQLQLKIESEVEKLLLRCQASYSTVNEQQQQLPPKAPVISMQQSGQVEKTQNINVKALNSHNLHLVNLLKQNSPHSAPVRHITPPTTTITTVCDSTTPTVAAPTNTHQKPVNQVIPPPQPRMQTPHQQNNPKPTTEVAQQVIVRLQKPVQQQPVQTCPNVVQIKVTPPVKRVVNTVPKTVLIKEQLNKDQNGVLNPDIKTPFLSKEDACRRLLQYHVYNNTRDPSWTELQEDDRKFTERSVALMDKISAINNKYRLLQLENSMRLCITPDQVLMERLFIQDEKEALLEDRATVAEGKSLSLPPPPQSWLKKIKAECRSPAPPPVVVKEEPYDPDEHDCCSRDLSDHPTLEDSDPLYKEDDNLEAPVIDSCEDIVVPPHDDNCERSPPTLKRIVIKPPSRSLENDSDDLAPSRKRLKLNNNAAFKSDWNRTIPKHGDKSESSDWSKMVSLKHGDKSELNSWNRTLSLKHSEKSEPSEWSRTIAPKHSDKLDSSDWTRIMAPKHSDTNNKHFDSKINHKFPLLTRETFNSDNRIDDVVGEFDMSPMEIGDDSRVGSHMVDMNTDFEPPVPRTEESSNDNLLYNSSLRNNCVDKYDFDLLTCSDWTEEYVPNQNESDMTVENIINNDHPSDLDLSGLDGLDNLDDSQHCIPNGNDDASTESDMNLYFIPKHNKRFLDSAQNCSNARDQVQSAIKSITGTGTEGRNYFDADFHLPMNRHGHNSHIAGYGGSVGLEMGNSSSNRDHRGDPDLEEAVRSILL